MLYREMTGKVIRAFYTVYNELGYGFLEKVYENAMVEELGRAGVPVKQQSPIEVYYKGIRVGLYVADLVVAGSIIVELKSATVLCPEHEAQLVNYLKASDLDVGLLLNFGPAPTFARKVFSHKSDPRRSSESA